MSWLTQPTFHRQSPRTRMTWLTQQRNFRCQWDNSPSPRKIRIRHLASQNFQPKNTVPNSLKIWIEPFTGGRIPWWGGRGRGTRSGSDDSKLSLVAWIFHNTGFFSSITQWCHINTYIHTWQSSQNLSGGLARKAHKHIFPENERLSLISRLGGRG